MGRVLILCLALFLAIPSSAHAEFFGKLDRKIWSLEAPNGFTRWLILRKHVIDRHGDLYHVEILQLRNGEQPWEFKRLAAHMALTENSLRWSIGRSLKEGDVDPADFDNAYAIWKEGRNPPICKTRVDDCLKGKRQ